MSSFGFYVLLTLERIASLLMSLLHDNSSQPSGINNKDDIIMTVAVISRFNEEQL